MAPKKEEVSRQLSMIFNHTRLSSKIGSLAGSKEGFPLVQVSSLWPYVTHWRRHGAFWSQSSFFLILAWSASSTNRARANTALWMLL